MMQSQGARNAEQVDKEKGQGEFLASNVRQAVVISHTQALRGAYKSPLGNWGVEHLQ